MPKNKGQHAVEFTILVGLVFLVGLLTVMIFGDNLNNFFSKNSISHSATNNNHFIDTNPYSKTDESQTKNSTTLKLTEEAQSIINSPEFQVNLKEFETSNLGNTFENSTGASGMDFVMQEINALMARNAEKYPDGNFPVEIIWGNGERGDCGPPSLTSFKDSCISGSAKTNMITLKLDDEVVLIQNDQTCVEPKVANSLIPSISIPNAFGSPCNDIGVHVVQGKIKPNNTYSGKITTYSTGGSIYKDGKYNATYQTTSSGFNFTNGSGKLKSTKEPIDWNFNFNPAP